MEFEIHSSKQSLNNQGSTKARKPCAAVLRSFTATSCNAIQLIDRICQPDFVRTRMTSFLGVNSMPHLVRASKPPRVLFLLRPLWLSGRRWQRWLRRRRCGGLWRGQSVEHHHEQKSRCMYAHGIDYTDYTPRRQRHEDDILRREPHKSQL